MGYHEREVTWFKEPGETNTDALLDDVKEYLQEEKIENIIVASTTGMTGAKASKIFKGRNVVVVTHAFGFKEPGSTELEETYKKEILANKGKIFTGTHALSSAERAIRRNFNTIEPLELIASVLRLMGEGTKVCVEIVLMAADAGLIPVDRDVIAIAGTGRGADTALRIKPTHSAKLFDLRIREVIAKPSNF